MLTMCLLGQTHETFIKINSYKYCTYCLKGPFTCVKNHVLAMKQKIFISELYPAPLSKSKQ